MIDSVEIIVPPTAQISEAVDKDNQPGLQVDSPSDPPVTGMWIWLPCLAVGEAHQFLADLAAH